MINILKKDCNNIKNTWNGIKSFISLKTVASNVPAILSLDNDDSRTNPYDIANTFNNYFDSITETTKKNIKYPHKHFSDYLSNENSSTMFLLPTDKKEIAIISSLNSNKTSGPNSIPYRILFQKMGKYVSLKILRSIYFAIFDSYLFYCCLVWAQNRSTI